MAEITATDQGTVEFEDPSAALYGTCRLGHARGVVREAKGADMVASLWCPVCQAKEE